MENEQDPELDNEIEAEEQEIDTNGTDDIALRPGPNADNQADVDRSKKWAGETTHAARSKPVAN